MINNNKTMNLFVVISIIVTAEKIRQNVISFYQPEVWQKIAVNGIQTHARINQRRTLVPQPRSRVRLWLMPAWVQIAFAATFVDIPRAVFSYDMAALIQLRGSLLDCFD